MRLLIIFLIQIFVVLTVSSQITGITASKVSSFNARAISKHGAEFELNYGVNHSSKMWDQDGNSQSLFQTEDSTSISTTFGIRLAYAFTETFELAAFVTPNSSNWSTKLNLVDQDKFSFALMGGVYLPFGNLIIDKNKLQSSQVRSYGLGLISSFEFSAVSSLDINLQIQDYFSSAPGLTNSDRFFTIDYGHYIQNSTILLIASFVYQNSSALGGNQTGLSFTPGISLEMNPNFIVLLNGSFGLSGKNMQKTNGFNVAWMINLPK